jgi:hypothetical protein
MDNAGNYRHIVLFAFFTFGNVDVKYPFLLLGSPGFRHDMAFSIHFALFHGRLCVNLHPKLHDF